MESSWHFKPEAKCLNKPVGSVRESQKGLGGSPASTVLIGTPVGTVCLALGGSDIFAEQFWEAQSG